MNMKRLSKRLSTLNQEQVAYINGCQTLQRAVWRICHEDPLFAIRNQIKKFTLREAILILISLRERNNRAILKLALHNWLKKVQKMNQNEERLRTLLKIIVKNYDSKVKNKLSTHLLKWRANTSVSEQEILRKYGHLFEFLDMLKFYSLLPAKQTFLKKLKKTVNPEKYLKPLKNIFRQYDRTQTNQLRKVIQKWRQNAKNLQMNDLKQMILRNTVLSNIRIRDRQLLQKAFNKWRNNVQADKLLDEFDEADFLTRVKSLTIIYGKWNKINKLNELARAFNKWRLNIKEKKEPLSSRILKAKQHMLKHNINKNAEDLLNALRDISEIKRLELLLKKCVIRAPKYNLPLLRKAFRKWYDNTKVLKTNEVIKTLKLKFATDLADRNRRDTIKETLRKTIHTWRNKTSVPKTVLPDTEKAIGLLRKATVQPFFSKMRENILKDMNKERFRALIAAYFRRGDKDLLHWWFGEWRKKAWRKKIYELKALLIKHLYNSKKRLETLRALYELRDRMNNYRFKDVLILSIIRNIVLRNEKAAEEALKGRLQRALYLWKSKIDHKKDQEKLDNFDQGTKILRRYCWRVTHEDIVNAFDYKITIPYIEKTLKRIVINTNKNNTRDSLLKAFYTWRMNTAKPPENKLKKLRELFDKYLHHETTRKQLFSPYKDLQKIFKKCKEDREDAARKIADYLRGIKEIPDQIRNLRIAKYLAKMIRIYSENDLLRIKYAVNEWARRARVLKADEDAKIIQRFIRDKLNKRLKKRSRLEEGVEHTIKYIKMIIFDKIVDHANKNKIPDILIKYYYRRNALDMKLLRDKFNHWRNLLPYMRLEDAASRIQAMLRGYLLRKDFDRFNRLTETMYKIVIKIIERNSLLPYLHKWNKNARKLKCVEDAKIIQEFCRKNLSKRLRSNAMKDLKQLFKDYIFKLIAKMMSSKTINPDDIDKLLLTIKKITCREPFEKLRKKIKWTIIIKTMTHIPNIYDKNRKEILRKYLDRWYTNAIIIPDEMANKIQNAWRSYLARKKLEQIAKLQYILENLVIKAITTDKDKKLTTLMKWNKNARKIKCHEDARIIQNFCRKIHDRAITSTGLKWKNLAKKIKPRRINDLAKFMYMQRLINKFQKRRFFDKLIDKANKNYLKEILKYLINKYDKEHMNNLLRKKLREWLDKALQLRDRDNDAATYIQSVFRGYLQRKYLRESRRLEEILTKLVLKILYTSDETLPSALHKWNKNARLLKCHEDARTIQNFCRNTLDKIKKIKEVGYLKKVTQGVDILDNLRLNIRYAWDKIRDYNKINGLKDLIGFLQDKINNVRRDAFEEIYQYGLDQLLRKLFSLREKLVKELLRKKLRQWKDKAEKLARLRAAEMIQRNWLNHMIEKIKIRITKVLRNIVERRNESDIDKLRRALKTWRDNAEKIARESAEKRIAKFMVETYLISNAR